MGTVSRVMAGCFAMSAFAVAIVAGLGSHNPATFVLSRALIAMILCYPVGYIVGIACERVIALHSKEYAQQNPVPTDDEDDDDGDAAESAVEDQEVEDVMIV